MSPDIGAPDPAPLPASPATGAPQYEGWKPSGIDDLEPTAWEALQDPGSVAVVAGPGAGKTEFLAQRAAYFLQTGICPYPQRILAISFKRDAAANLGRRVAARTPEHAGRFVSMTFDAFTKGLVDRFATALPQPWRLAGGYDIHFAAQREVDDFLNTIARTTPAALRNGGARIQSGRFLADVVGGWDLPANLPSPADLDSRSYAAYEWWRTHHLLRETAQLDFTMINRLAELLVRTVPKLKRALRQTYPIVFVDEFQDTTTAQFSFLRSVFGEDTAVTAVGDGKQRIMGWAGALPEAFERFKDAFSATVYPLEWNFRSNAALVELQHIIASRLDPTAVKATSKAASETSQDPVQLWAFPTPASETETIADWIANDIASSDRRPVDFALIARQKIADFEPRFRSHLAAHGIKVRNDDERVGKMTLQDLLKNETARLLLGLLRLADEPAGLVPVWREVAATMSRVYGAGDDEEAQRRIGDKLATMTTTLRTWLKSHPSATTPAAETLHQLLDLADPAALHRYVKATTPGDDLDTLTGAFQARLAAVSQTASSWKGALDDFESADAVVLLTAHRSKGLEYHTVFFLGIREDQWWAFGNDPAEGTSTFFVGLSRAGQRLIFTTDQRPRTGLLTPLFSLLKQAGVPGVRH
ncbi:UvrD-helicase domain-containing protein [Kitasatospora sp. NE20-6]|uniref:UvrD-helicase domain-containing protein n=1 Tax=Kitasatospora sp. NE20-6 TaxID=2859066 RepID=UPI0038B39149